MQIIKSPPQESTGTTSNNEITQPIRVEHKDVVTAAKGGGVSFAGRLFEYVLRFGFGILIARFIGVEQYGLYTLGITVASIASNAAMLGLQTGMVRYLPPAIRQKDDPTIRGIIQISVGLPAVVSLILGMWLYALADQLAMMLFHDPRMASIMRISSLLIPLTTLGSMAYVVTISFKQPKYSVIANNIISPLLRLMMAGGFLLIGMGTRGVLIAQVIADTAGLLLLVYFINSLFALRKATGPAVRNTWQLLRYSIPVYLGWMINTLSGTFSTLALGFLGLAAGVGVFTASSRFSQIGSMFYLSIGNISTPIIADLHSQRKTAQMKAYYQTTTRWLLTFNLPVFLTSFLFARPLLSIFGDDFTAGAASMMILAFGTLAYTGTGVGANILDMTDHPKVNAVNSAIMVLVTVALNWLFVPPLGVIGAAIASAASTVMVNLVCLVEVWFLLGIQPYNRTFLKPILASLISGVAAYLVDRSLPLPFLAELIVGGGTLWAVYALVLYLLRLAPEDKALVDSLVSRLRTRQPAVQNAVR